MRLGKVSKGGGGGGCDILIKNMRYGYKHNQYTDQYGDCFNDYFNMGCLNIGCES